MTATNQPAPYYRETSEKLQIRIQAHTQFTNRKLEDWFLEQLSTAHGRRLLEIGCGDGNYFPTYSHALGKQGQITGFDMSPELIRKAAMRAAACETPIRVIEWNFDKHPYPFADGEMDYVVAPFSAYYTKDVPAWVADGLRVLTHGGQMLLLGPTRDNSRELYELNKLVTGVSHVPETDDTSNKMESAFLPALMAYSELQMNQIIIEREIVFPTATDFARYYFATGLYETTTEKTGRHVNLAQVVEAVQQVGLRLNKKIICLKASKARR